MTPEPIVFRCFRQDDLPEIMRIQDASLRSNLSDAEQADGFLTVVFTEAQLAQMHADIPIVVADCGSRLAGYLCGSSLAFSAKVPLLARMMALFPETAYKGKPLDHYASFFYGPVCVDHPFRGKGVLKGLFRKFLAQMTGRFEVGVLFVSEDNTRSQRAHIHKLGMRKLCDFSFNGNDYGLLVFDVSA